jgi:CRISPR-associated protein Cas2
MDTVRLELMAWVDYKEALKKTDLAIVPIGSVEQRGPHPPLCVKILKEYGVRVQKSVFECGRMNEKQFLRMKHRLEDKIDHGEDTVRFYPVCRDFLGKVEYSGTGRLPSSDGFKIV